MLIKSCAFSGINRVQLARERKAEVNKRHFKKYSSDPQFMAKNNRKRQERRLKFNNSLTDEKKEHRWKKEKLRIAQYRKNCKEALSKGKK